MNTTIYDKGFQLGIYFYHWIWVLCYTSTVKKLKLIVIITIMVFVSEIIHSDFHHHHKNNSAKDCTICVFSSTLSNGDAQSVHIVEVTQIIAEVSIITYKNFFFSNYNNNIEKKRGPPIF